MSKLAWVLLPILLYCAYAIGARLLRGRPPSRQQLNVELSLLLMLYLLATAGLGIFWVASQQLPVFDWHYLFGYGTLALVLIHLYFNLPRALRMLCAPPRRTASGAPDATDNIKNTATGPELGACAAEGVETKRVGKEPNSSPLLRDVAVATSREMGAKWDFSPSVWADELLPRTLLGLAGTRWGPVKTVAILMAVAGAAYLLGARQQAAAPPAGIASGSDVSAILRYHEFSSESRRDVFARAPAINWGDAPADFKTYTNAPHIKLARGQTGQRGLSASLRGAFQREQPLQVSELGDLLFLSAGITKRQQAGRALRASPSSGALFSGELYVLVRSVQGLAPGIYHYDPDQERLDLLGPLPPTARSHADATVVLASVVRRTAYKYEDRAYRYITADGGHLLENLRVASQSAGMQATLSTQFDEQLLAQTLGIDGLEEIVLAAMELQRAAAPVPAADGDQAGRYVAAQSGSVAATGATGAVHQATSLRLPPLPANAIVLPAPEASSAMVHQVITQRRSKRRFTADAVPLAALSGILDDMRQQHQLSTAIRINLVVNRVQGLAPGVYRYDPRHALTLVRSGVHATAASAAALSQDVIGDAAVVLVLSAERAPLLAEGPRGYRHGFLEAGLVSERWLLGAVARQLGACPVGAFYDDEAAALIGVDPQREWVLHFAALGVPAAE